MLEGLVARFDHVGVAGPRIRDLLPIYHELLGGRFLKGGDHPRFNYRALQLEYADGTRIELLEPLPGSTFFDSFFRRGGGGGLHHVTFTVGDMQAAIEALCSRGFSLTGLYLEDRSWQEVFLHPREAYGTLVQLAHSEIPLPETPGLTIEQMLSGQGPDGRGIPSP